MNAINIIIAENEEGSPWEPLSVRRGEAAGTGGQPAGGIFTVIVTGASHNNYFSIGGLRPGQSVRIDEWR